MVQKMHQHLIKTMLNTYAQPKDQEKMQKVLLLYWFRASSLLLSLLILLGCIEHLCSVISLQQLPLCEDGYAFVLSLLPSDEFSTSIASSQLVHLSLLFVHWRRTCFSLSLSLRNVRQVSFSLSCSFSLLWQPHWHVASRSKLVTPQTNSSQRGAVRLCALSHSLSLSLSPLPPNSPSFLPLPFPSLLLPVS